MTAIGNDRMLYTSVEGYYLAGPYTGGDPRTDPNDRERIGLDNHRLTERIPEYGLRTVTAIGRVQICEDVRDIVEASAEEGQIVWVSGFCHMANGPYLWLHDVKVGPRARLHRLIGEEMRSRLGDLMPAPPAWPHRDFVESHARDFLAALRGDREAFSRLHGGKEAAQSQEAMKLAYGSHRGFAALRRGPAAPQQAILIEDIPGPAVVEPTDQIRNGYASTICFCVRPDCTGLWPIAKIDADNRQDRPYVCTWIGSWIEHKKLQLRFQTKRGQYGLPEPRSGS